MIREAVYAILAVAAVLCAVLGLVALVKQNDGRATAYGVMALACYAVAQLAKAITV